MAGGCTPGIAGDGAARGPGRQSARRARRGTMAVPRRASMVARSSRRGRSGSTQAARGCAAFGMASLGTRSSDLRWCCIFFDVRTFPWQRRPRGLTYSCQWLVRCTLSFHGWDAPTSAASANPRPRSYFLSLKYFGCGIRMGPYGPANGATVAPAARSPQRASSAAPRARALEAAFLPCNCSAISPGRDLSPR